MKPHYVNLKIITFEKVFSLGLIYLIIAVLMLNLSTDRNMDMASLAIYMVVVWTFAFIGAYLCAKGWGLRKKKSGDVIDSEEW